MNLTSINFVLVLNLLNSTGSRGTRVALALFAIELGAQPLTIGLLAAMFSLFPMLFSISAGKLADRFGARWLLLLAAAGGGAGMLAPYFYPGLPAVFIATALIGLNAGFSDVLLQNLTGVLSNPQNRARNFSNLSMMKSLANVLGPLLAGIAIDHSGHAVTCVYIALLTAVVIPMLAFDSDEPRGSTHDAPRTTGGVGILLADPVVRKVLITSSLLLAGRDMFGFYLPVYARSVGLSATAIGIVLAVNFTTAFFIRIILPPLIARFSEERLLIGAFFLGGTALMLIPFFESAVTLSLIAFLFGLGMGVGDPIIMMLMYSHSPPGRSGESLGLRMTASHMTKLVAPVTFGAMASVIGLSPVFWIIALMLGAGGMVGLSTSGSPDSKLRGPG